MRRLILACCLVLLFTSKAQAWSETYCWASAVGATSYRLDISSDNVVWTTIQTVTLPITVPPGCPAGLLGTVVTSTIPTLTLVRLAACNAAGCAIRSTSGFFHNDAWVLAAPPAAPLNLVVP